MRVATPARAGPAGYVYYLRPTGDDAADGRSPATAWRSIERANRAALAPGGALLFEGGARFSGTVRLGAGDAGRAELPVVVSSFGSGRATIAGAGNAGIVVHNTAGVVIRDLVVVGDPVAYRRAAGISVFTDLPGSRRLDGIAVSRVDVSGFKHGVDVGSSRAGSGFGDVRISDAVLRDNLEAGFASYGPGFDPDRPSYAHERVHLTRVEAYRNLGDPANRTRNTGSGLVLGSVRGGTVEHCSAHDNGSACVAPEGPVGIWAYDSTGIVIQYSVAYRNRTGGPADGDGFDLDQNVSESALQHNVSYQNDGAGYLLYSGRPDTTHEGTVVRFNLSSDDARRSDWYGGITLAGAVRNAKIHHNAVTVSVVTASAVAASAAGRLSPAALRVHPGPTGVTIRGNVLASEAGPAVAAPALPGSAILLGGDDYGNDYGDNDGGNGRDDRSDNGGDCDRDGQR